MTKDEQLLEIAVKELKSMSSTLSSMYESLKNKFVLFSSGELAYLAYLYSSTNVSSQEEQIKRLFIPIELSSQIFYVIGIVLSFLSLCFLFQGFLPSPWMVSPKSKDLKSLNYSSRKELLSCLRDEYFEAIQHNGSVYESKNSAYLKGLVCLITGNIILFIIRFFGTISIGG